MTATLQLKSISNKSEGALLKNSPGEARRGVKSSSCREDKGADVVRMLFGDPIKRPPFGENNNGEEIPFEGSNKIPPFGENINGEETPGRSIRGTNGEVTLEETDLFGTEGELDGISYISSYMTAFFETEGELVTCKKFSTCGNTHGTSYIFTLQTVVEGELLVSTGGLRTSSVLIVLSTWATGIGGPFRIFLVHGAMSSHESGSIISNRALLDANVFVTFKGRLILVLGS